MSDTNERTSEVPAERLSAKCSFCLRDSKTAGMLIEGCKRDESGPSYICQDCVELCTLIFERAGLLAAGGDAGENPIGEATRDLLSEEIDERLKTLTNCEREIIKLRCGVSDTETHTLEEIGRRFNLTPKSVLEIESRAVSILQSRTPGVRS